MKKEAPDDGLLVDYDPEDRALDGGAEGAAGGNPMRLYWA